MAVKNLVEYHILQMNDDFSREEIEFVEREMAREDREKDLEYTRTLKNDVQESMYKDAELNASVEWAIKMNDAWGKKFPKHWECFYATCLVPPNFKDESYWISCATEFMEIHGGDKEDLLSVCYNLFSYYNTI